MQTSSGIPTSVKWVGAILAGLAACIAAYKFFFQRPALRIVSESQDNVKDGQIKSTMKFNIVNAGLGFADDTYIEFSLSDWNFGDEPIGQSSGINVQVNASDSSEPEEAPSNYVEKSLRAIDFLAEIAAEWENNDQTEFWSRDSSEGDEEDIPNENITGIQFTETILDTKHDETHYIGTAGEVNQIFIDDVLHSDSEFLLFWATAKLERFHTYELEYSVGCRAHGPKSGKIILDVGYDEIDVEHRHPNLWWAHAAQALKRVRALKPTAPPRSTQTVRVQSTSIEKENLGFYHTQMTPRAVVRASSSDDKLMTVIAKATLYMGEKRNENIVGTITHTAHSLQYSETWETTYSGGRRSTITTASQSHIDSQQPGPPLRWSPLLEPYPRNPRAQLQVDWSVKHNTANNEKLQGINVIRKELITGNSSKAGHTPVRVEGRLENRNVRGHHVFVISKFYGSGGRVLTTNHSGVNIGGESEETFRANAGLSIEQESRIKECKLVLRTDLG